MEKIVNWWIWIQKVRSIRRPGLEFCLTKTYMTKFAELNMHKYKFYEILNYFMFLVAKLLYYLSSLSISQSVTLWGKWDFLSCYWRYHHLWFRGWGIQSLLAILFEKKICKWNCNLISYRIYATSNVSVGYFSKGHLKHAYFGFTRVFKKKYGLISKDFL